MKTKKLASLILIATTLALGGAVSAYAAPVDDVAVETNTGTDNIEEDDEEDEEEEEGDDKEEKLTITSKCNSVLLEVGQAFNPATDLGVEVIDPKEGDLTDTVEFEKIDTSKAGIINYVIGAQNSEGDTASLTVVIRVVNIVDSIKIESLDKASEITLDSIVIEEVEGVTVTIGEVNKEKSTLEVKISDGENQLTKLIALTDLDGETFATSLGDASDIDDLTKDKNNTLPSTGGLAETPMVLASFLALASVGALKVSKKKHTYL